MTGSSPFLSTAGSNLFVFLAATFQITDTLFGEGDKTFSNLDGLLVLEYTDDGPVNVLQHWVYNDFVVSSAVTVATKVHGFAPSCNTWGQPMINGGSATATRDSGSATTNCN